MWWRSPLPRLPRSHPFVDFLRSDSASRHILECGDPGVWPMTPSFELGRNFGTLHLTAKFYHPTFNRSEVIMLTNKLTNRQTPLKTPTSLGSAMLRRWIIISYNIPIAIYYCYSAQKLILLSVEVLYDVTVCCYWRTWILFGTSSRVWRRTFLACLRTYCSLRCRGSSRVCLNTTFFLIIVIMICH